MFFVNMFNLFIYTYFLAADSDSTTQPETASVGSTNQTSEEQATRPSPSSATSDQNLRFNQY